MTSRFKIWNNVHRAMTPLAHWYAILDNDIILDIQNKVIHEILHDTTCLIKWAPMHEQVTMLQKLLSHIFEQYADIQDDGYISDEDIEYPETFMPRPRIMQTYKDQCNHSSHSLCKSNLIATLSRDLNRASAKSGEYCSHQKSNRKMNRCHWMTSTSTMKVCTSQMTPQNGSMNHHQTGTYAFMTNTRMDANISEHHPVQTPQ